jgi:hypothetical protein
VFAGKFVADVTQEMSRDAVTIEAVAHAEGALMTQKDFHYFLGQSLASKELEVFSVKNAIISANYFGENVFKIITLTPM